MTAPRPGAEGWGPSHQTRARRAPWWQLIALLLLLCLSVRDLVLLCGAIALIKLAWRTRHLWRRHGNDRPAGLADSTDSLLAVLVESVRRGSDVYLGVDEKQGWRCARPERAVLLLGPPRSGKTSAVIIPALLSHCGPAVSTSTKPDVLHATLGARARLGRVWLFDPTGTSATPAGVSRLRWSPVSACGSWDGALLMARAMVLTGGVGAGTTDQSHWAKRAQALLACLLHAAAVNRQTIGDVVGWVLGHELDEPGVVLEQHGCTQAVSLLGGLARTAPADAAWTPSQIAGCQPHHLSLDSGCGTRPGGRIPPTPARCSRASGRRRRREGLALNRTGSGTRLRRAPTVRGPG